MGRPPARAASGQARRIGQAHRSLQNGQLADLELRHRCRAPCEDRIRCAKDTGLRNLPLHGYAQNQVWCEIVALACELLAWTQMLALTSQARRCEPKRLRLRIFACAGQREGPHTGPEILAGRLLRLPLPGSFVVKDGGQALATKARTVSKPILTLVPSSQNQPGVAAGLACALARPRRQACAGDRKLN